MGAISSFLAGIKADKRRRRIFVWSALGVLLLIFIFLPGPKKIDVRENSNPPAEPTVTSEAVQEDRSGYVIDARYPVLQNVADGKIKDAVNADIRKAILEEVAGFRDSAANPLNADKSSLKLAYTTGYLDRYVWSVLIESNELLSGAPHADQTMETYTYDLRSGRRVELGDLFIAGSDYLSKLSDYSKGALAAALVSATSTKNVSKDQVQAAIVDATAPREGNYHFFLLTKDGLRFFFYDVLPAAASPEPQSVVVPYSVVAAETEPAGVLAARSAP